MFIKEIGLHLEYSEMLMALFIFIDNVFEHHSHSNEVAVWELHGVS